MKIYRAASLILALLFATTGILFLGWPDKVSVFFNMLSSYVNRPPSPASGGDFYLILAAGYMYLVTVLSFLMFKQPGNRYFPLLLIHGKLASSILSLVFFLLQSPYLIYLANFIIDGVIGIIVIILYLHMRRTEWACC
jgi:hypothetical protein